MECCPPSGKKTYSSAISNASNYATWLLDIFGDRIRGDILEVGLGHGSYVAELSKRGRYHGVDIDAESVSHAREAYPDTAFDVLDITQQAFIERFAESQNTIVCLNVLEHIEDDALAFANLTRALCPGGYLLLVVPAMPALYNDLDRLAGHYRRYTLTRLAQATEGVPVTVEDLRYFNPIGGLGWYINKFKHYDSLNDNAVNGQIVLFDKYCVPFSRALSPLFAKTFGQSALLIARKHNAS